MIRFKATLFDGKSSIVWPVTIILNGTFLEITKADDSTRRAFDLASCTIEPRLGSTARAIILPDGSRCETSDHEAVVELENLTGQNRGMRITVFLESHWRMTALATLGLIAAIWAMVYYGIPSVSEKAAFSVSRQVLVVISDNTMKVLDERLMRPTALARKSTSGLRKTFEGLTGSLHSGYDYRLEFRNSPAMGPNAFALPSGLIVMTDQMVDISEDERELVGIMLHEIAHVEKRHGMRMIIQNAGVFLLISAVVGDVASITSAASSLPAILAQTGYSRGFEREADMFAASELVDRGMGTGPLRDILARMTEGRATLPGESVYSTHPVMEERLEFLENFQKPGGQ